MGIVLTSLGIAMLGGATYLWVRRAREREVMEADDVPDISFDVAPTVDVRGGAGVVISGRF